VKAPTVSKPLGWLLTAVSANALATDHNIDAVAGFTTVTTTGTNTQQVVNGYTSGGVAINVFNHFVVGNGNTVNLVVPAGSAKLVNIVRSSQPEVWGTLASYQNGTLGGDVTFASSYGFLVGSTGVVNVGKLTLRTPSQGDIDNFVSGSKSIGDLTSGSYTMSGSGLVSIQGKVNTQSGVVIDADQVVVGSGAAIIAGNAKAASYVNDAAVNTGDLTAPKTLKSDGGTISIVAKGSSGTAVDISGSLLADGGITIEAPTIALKSGSSLDTRNGTSGVAAGDVTLTASAEEKLGYGQASATTSLSLAGSIQAVNLNATATSHARSVYTDDLGDWIGMTTLGAVSGISGYAVMADADATVTVASTANVQATGDVTLGSVARATASDPAITLNGNSLVGAAVVYGNATSDSTTQVKSGATINAGGKLSVTAHNETDLNVSALTLVATNDNTAVVAVAVGDGSTHSKAQVETGASLTAGSVAVHADNQNAFYVGAGAYGLAGTALGVSVALGDFTTSAIADMGASVGTNLAKVGDVSVVALDRTTEQRVHSSSTVGASVLMRTVGAGAIGALGAAQSAVNSLVKSVLPTSVLGDVIKENDGTLSLRVGAAFSLSQSDHEAIAHIGNNVSGSAAPSIVSSGNVVVAARADQREMRTTSESSVSGRTSEGSGTSRDPEVENSGSVAINLAIGDSRAIAEVGNYTSIDAARVGVAAQQYQPLVSTYDRWSSFSDFVDHLNATAGLGNSLLSSYANASGEAEENSVAGSLNYQQLSHDTKAWVGDRASLKTSAAAGAWSLTQTLSGLGNNFSDTSYTFDFSAAVDVNAYNQAQSIDIAGNVGALLILAGTGSGEDGKSLGASLSYVNVDANTVAGIGASATVNAGAGDVSVTAKNDDAHIVITPTSGVGSGLAFNGIVGVLDMDNQTRASINNSASITASSVDLEAHQYAGNWAAAGSFAYTDSKAVGIAVAINLAEGTTQATIGDNSADAALVTRDNVATTTASGTAPAAGIATESLTVHASTDGTSGAIAAAGAATTPKTGEPGYGEQFESKWNALQAKAKSALGIAGGSSGASSAGGASKSGQQDSGSGDSVPSDPGFGLAGSGSVAVIVSDLDTTASVSNATITARTTRSGIDVQALEKTVELSAAGSAAFIKAGKEPTSSTTAISGAFAVLTSSDDTQAFLSNVTALQAGAVSVQAAQGGERLGIGLGFSVNTNSADGKNYSVGTSASVAQIKDSASARIENGSHLDAVSNTDTLDVSAYSRTDIGIGGGSLFAGGKGGVGLSLAYADIGDGSRDATEARIDASTLADFGSIALNATNANRIASGAAGLGGGSGTNSFNGSFVINEVGGHQTAKLSSSTLTNTGALTLAISGGVDSGIDNTLDGLGSGSENGDYDFSGSILSDGTQASAGARVLGVAGFLQAGKNNVGLAYVHNDVHRTGAASITGSSVNATSVGVSADDSSWMVSVAAGVGMATGSLSGVGSVAVNEVNNQLSAEIGDWDAVSASGYIKAGSVSVNATNRAEIAAAAGSVALSKGVSGGLAVSLNLLGTDEHSTTARIGWTDLYTNGTVDVSASSGTSGNMNTLISTGVGVALAQGGLAFAGSIGVNNVDQSVDAGIRAVSMLDGATQYRASTVNVQAHDYTENWAFGFMAAGAQNGVAAGIGISTNRIDSDVTAQVLGGRSTTLMVSDLSVDATRKNNLVTVDAGISVSGGLSGAASVGTNVTDGHVLSQIASGAKVDALNNVAVTALADTFSAVGSGAVGVGAGAASGALAVSTAIDFGTTEALVDNATVKALGRGNTVNVRSGALSNGPTLTDLSTASNGVDRDALSTSFEDQTLSEGSEAVRGLVVNATSYEKLRTVNVAGSASTGAAAVTINVATNDFEGTTRAKITNSTINSGVSGESGADVTVRGSDHSMGLAISAGLAGASAGAGIAGLSMNLQTHDVDARIEGSTTTADAVKIDATATQMAQAVSAGGSGAATGAGSASVVVTTQYGDVKSWLLGGTTTAGSVAVTAERQQESDVAAGAASGSGQVGVGFGLAVSRLGGDTRATIGRDPDDDNATTTTTVNADSVTVDAARAATINSYTFGVGIGVGAVGVAGMVNVSDEGGDTRAGIYDTTLRAKNGTGAVGSLAIDAQEIYSAEQMAAGVGGGFTGIGAAFNVVLSNSSTVAELVGSDVKATSTSITAEADREASVYSFAGGGGAFAGAVSLGFIKFGAGDSGGADSQLTNTASAADSTVNASYASGNSQLTAAEQAQLDANSGGMGLNSQVQTSAVSPSATVTGDGEALKVANASLLAARVSGGKLDTDSLTVDTDGRTHTYTLSGAVQGSMAGLSGGLGITREYIVNSAIVDTQLTARGVNVSATERDGAGGSAGEIEAFSAGVGALVIGVAYSDVLVQDRVVAGVTRAVGNDTGQLSVSARDITSVKVGGDNEDSPENVSVGTGVIGASVSRAEKNSDVDAFLGKSGSTIDGYADIGVTGLVSGQVRATGFAVSAGVIGVMGVSSNAEDNSSVDAQLIGNVDTGASGSLDVTASSVPQTYARAYGVTVAAGAAVGGSFSYATANTSATASVADNVVFTGSGTVNVTAQTGDTSSASQGSYFSADAKALAASGGLLAGVAATEVTAKNTSKTTAKIGNYVTLPVADLNVTAFNYSGQRADGDAYFGGAILGVGSNTSTAKSGTSARVLLGINPVATVTRSGDLNLTATSTDRNEAFATGGGGGVISGSAAEAFVTASDSDNAPAASVEVADWTNARTIVGTGGLKIRATHDTQFFSGADTTAVSVVGGAAANATTTIDLDAKVVLGKYVAFESQAVDIAAKNAVDQIGSPSLSGWDTSVNAGAGGGINGYAAKSTINIDNQGAAISLGDNASLDVFALSAHETLGNRLRLDAYSTLSVDDAAKLSTGGAIQAAVAKSSVTATANNSITLGQNVELTNEVDTVQLGTYSYVNVWSAANAKTYAAVGAAGGSSEVTVTVNNGVTLGQNAKLTGYGSVSLYAGRSADSITDNTMLVNAVSDVYNWTAAPVDTSVTADATANVNNNIDIGTGVAISSVRNVWMQADEGRVYATGTGRGHNPYLELFSSEIKAGSGKTNTSSTVTFEGTATVEAGSRHDQSVTIAADGTVTKGTGTEATVYNLSNFSSRDSLQTYINTLTAQNAAVDAYVATLSASEQAAYTYSASYQQTASELSFLTPLLSELSNTTVNGVYVGNITAAGGDVHLAADKVLVKSGAPSITAHGDPTITITNNSAKALIVDTLAIPNDAGGQVLVTGGASDSLPAALKVNESSTSGGSQITITHNPSIAGADLFIQGDITNLGGTVKVDVEQGSLLQTANIAAKAMDISVSDIYLVNVSGMQSYGFSPLALSGYVTSSRGWKPVSAEEAVAWYISDKYASDIASKGITAFNSSLYGADYAAYSSGSTVVSNIFFNWGFNDSDECHTSCVTFNFPNHAGGSDRGNGNWGFDLVGDYTGKMRMSTDYATIKNSGFLGTAVTKDALNASFIAINAGTIDVNGTIRAGNFNNWSVNVADTFDSAIATYIEKTGLKAGDTITITPGQPLYYYDKVKSCSLGGLFCTTTVQRISVDTGVSLMTSGDAGITLNYDVSSGKLTMDDVKANGNGTVLLRGKIVSTGQDGKILIDDGLGTIRVNNASTKQLVVNDLDAGSQTTGLIRITDTNYADRTDWFVHEPGALVKHYVTGSSAQTYTGVSGTTEGYWDGSNATTTYNPKTGQWYKWTESAEVLRSYTAPVDGWYSKYLPVGDWKFANQDTPWTVSGGSITTSCSFCGGNYLSSDFRYGSITQDWTAVDYTYSNYYGSTFTDRNWQYKIPYDLKMAIDYYVKADNPIKLQFIGASQGTVAVTSTPTVTLNGSISNSLGSTSVVSAGGNIETSASAIINSASLKLGAAGTIGTSTQAVNAITSQIDASAGGLVNLNLTAQNSSIGLQQIASSSGNVTVVADKSLAPVGSGTHLAGNNVSVTSTFGALGDVALGQTVNTNVTGQLTVSARGDINLRQKSGNLTVNTIASEAGDVGITLDNGRLLNGIDTSSRTAEETAYLAGVWSSLNMTGADAGLETVKAFENQVSAKYQQYYLIKQRLSDSSDAAFAISTAYLEAMRTRVAAQKGVSTASLSDADVTAAVKAEYDGIKTFFSGQFGASQPFDASAAYDSTWRYTVDPSSALYANLTAGAQWKQSQLDIAISSAAVTPVTSGYISSRAANISGNNVTLNVSQGSVGEDAASLNIAISRSNPVISTADQAALVSAGPGDLSFSTTATQILATVKQLDPVKVNATGTLKVLAHDAVYVESDDGLTLGGLQSTNGNVRLTAGGNIASGSGSATTISAGGLNIATTQGSIGTSAAPINLALTDALRVASAPGDIWLAHNGGGLALGSIGAGGTLSVSAGGALTNWASNSGSYHIVADNVSLSAASGGTRYDIGTSTRPVSLRLTGGDLSLNANNAYIDVTSTGSWGIGTTTLKGAYDVDTTGNVSLSGNLSAASVSLSTTGNVIATNPVSWTTTGATSISGASLSLANTGFDGSQVSLIATAGALDVGSVTSRTGQLQLLATGGIGVHGGITAGNGLLADGQSFSMDGGSAIAATGAVTITAIDTASLGTLTASGLLDVTAGSIVFGGTAHAFGVTLDAHDVSLAAGASVHATNAIDVSADTIDMASGSQFDAGTTLGLTTTGHQTLAQLHSGAAMALTAGGDITLGAQAAAGAGATIDAGGALNVSGPVTIGGAAVVRAGGAVTQSAGSSVYALDGIDAQAGSWTMGSSSQLSSGSLLSVKTVGSQSMAQLGSLGTLSLDAGGSLALNEQVTSGGNAALKAVTGITLADGQAMDMTGSLQLDAASFAMGSASRIGTTADARLNTSGDVSLAQLLVGRDLLVNASGKATIGDAVAVNGDATLTTGGALGVAGDVDIHGALVVRSAGAVTQAAGHSLSADAAIDAQAASWSMGSNSLLSAGSTLSVKTLGDQALAQLQSGGVLSLDAGGSIVLNEQVVAGGDALLNAVDGVTLAAGQRFGVAGGLQLDAASLAMGVGSKIDTIGDARLTTSGNASLARLAIGGNLDVNAGGDAVVGETTTVAGNASLTTGGALHLAGAVAAQGVVTIVAAGNVTQDAGEGLRTADALDLQAASWHMGAGSSLVAGSALGLRTAGDQSLGQLHSGGALSLDAGGSIALNEHVITGSDATLNAVNGITLAAGQTVDVTGSLNAVAASFAMGAGSRIGTSADVILNTTGDSALAQLVVARDLLLFSGGKGSFGETVTVAGDASLTTGTSLGLTGAFAVQGNATIRSGGAVTQATGNILSTGGAIDAQAASWTMGGHSQLAAGTALNLQTLGNQALAQLQSGDGLSLDAGGSIALNEQVTTGGDTTLKAVNGITVAAGQTVDVTGNLNAAAASLAVGAGSKVSATLDAIVGTTGDSTLAQLSVGRDLVLASGGKASFGETVTVAGDASLTTGTTLDLTGAFSVQGNATIRSGGAVTQSTGNILSAGGAIDAQAASWTMGPHGQLTAGTALSLQTLGNQALAQLQSGNGLSLDAGGSIALNEHLVSGGDATLISAHGITLAAAQSVDVAGGLQVNAASIAMGAGSQITTASDALFDIGGNASLAQLSIGRDLGIDAAGNLAFSEASTVTGNALVRAGGDMRVSGPVAAQGAMTVMASGDVTQDAGQQMSAGGAFDVQATTWHMGAASSMVTGSTLSLQTAGDQSLAQLHSGGALSLDAGGSVALNEQVIAGGDATLKAVNGITIAAGQTVDVTGSLNAAAASFAMGAGSHIGTSADAILNSTGDSTLAQLSVGRDLVLAAGAMASFGETVTVAGDASLTTGTSLDVAGAFAVQGNATIRSGGAVTQSTGNILSAGGAIEAQAASWTMGAQSQLAAGTVLNLQTLGNQALAQLQSSDGLSLDAGGSIALNEQVITGGDATLKAVNGITVAAGQTVDVTGSLNAAAASFAMGAGSKVNATLDAIVGTTGDSTLAQLSVGRDLVLAAGGAASFGETVTVGRDARVTTGGTLDLAGPFAAEGNATLHAGGAATQAPGNSLTAGGAVDAQAASWTMGDHSRLAAGSTLNLKTLGNQTLAALQSGGALSLDAGGSMAMNEPVTAGGDATLKALRGITLAAGQTMDVAGSLHADAASITMGAGSKIHSTLDTIVSTTGDSVLAQLAAGRDLRLASGGSSSFGEAVTVVGDASLTTGSTLDIVGPFAAQGGVTIRSVGGVTQAANNSLSAGGAIDAQAASWTMGEHSAIRAGSTLAIKTLGGQTLATVTSGDALSLDAGDSIAFNERVTAGADATLHAANGITLTAGQAVDVAGSLRADTASLAMGTGSRIGTATDLDVITSGDSTLSQLAAGRDVVIDAGGKATLSEAVTAGRDASLVTGGALTVTGPLTVQGKATIRAGGAVVQAAGNAMSAGSAIDAQAASWTMGLGSELSAGTTLALTTAGRQTLAQLHSGSDLSLAAADSIVLGDVVSVGGDATVATGGRLDMLASVAAQGAIAIDATGAVTLASGKTMSSGGALDVHAAALQMNAGSRIATGSDARITTGAGATLSQLDIGRDLVVDAGGDIALDEAAIVARDATLTSGERIDVKAPLAVGRDLHLASASDATVKAATTVGGNASVQSAADVLLQGNLTVGGDLSLAAAGSASQAAAQSTVVGGNVDMQAASWTMGSGSSLRSEGSLDIASTGDVTLSSLTVHGATLGISAGGMLRGLNDSAVHLDTGSADTHTTLTAGLGLGDPLVANVPWLSVATTTGDINLIVERGVYSPLLSAEQGKVNLTVHGSLTFDHLLGNPWLWVDGAIKGQQLTMATGSLNSRESLDIANLALQGGGPLAVAAPSVALHIDALDAPVTSLTLTGFDGARADSMAVSVVNTSRVEIDRLYTRDADLQMPVDVSLRNASASGALTLTTAAVTISLDNVNPAARAADAQLITPQGSFWLQLDGNALYTDALVTRFQAPVALYFHRDDEVGFDAQQAFYHLSAEHLSQQIDWTHWRLPAGASQGAPSIGPWLSLPGDGAADAPAVNVVKKPRPKADSTQEAGDTAPQLELHDDDIVVGLLQP